MNALWYVAFKHLLARKRQSLVSLLGIVLGVAFFLAIAALMQGSENDFIRRLVDNTPHITVYDEFRNPRKQPLAVRYPERVTEVRNVKPVTETRGIRGYERLLPEIRTLPGIRASPVLVGQALVSFAGKERALSLNGMIPAEINDISTIRNFMIDGQVDDLIAEPDGIIIGHELARTLSLSRFNVITVVAPQGQVRTFRIVGIFRTGRSDYDNRQAFVALKRAQALFGRSHRINNIVIRLNVPQRAREVAATIEARIGFKAVSWQEASEDLMKTLAIRNTIMYTVVSAVLIVAAFGIYNVISTVVLEKQRDIAILKSMGFYAQDIQQIFLIQGIVLGLIGCMLGLPLGSLFMYGLMQIRFKAPGSSEIIQMPIEWAWQHFAIAGGFALCAALFAAYLPARKASRVYPVDILRGS
jgi:lipoprotein-releasing system permease protein